MDYEKKFEASKKAKQEEEKEGKEESSSDDDKTSKPVKKAFAWLDDEKSFLVLDHDVFCNDVLKAYGLTYLHSKYESFVRKLHRWGFVRLSSKTTTDCFHHKRFRKGRIDLAKKCICKPRNDNPSVNPATLKQLQEEEIRNLIRAGYSQDAMVLQQQLRHQELHHQQQYDPNSALKEPEEFLQEDSDEEDDEPPSLAGVEKYWQVLLHAPGEGGDEKKSASSKEAEKISDKGKSAKEAEKISDKAGGETSDMKRSASDKKAGKSCDKAEVKPNKAVKIKHDLLL